MFDDPRTGRPTKLTYDMIAALEREIELGIPYRVACDLAGISYQTFRNWQTGKFPARTSQKMQDEFFDRIQKAEARAFKILYLRISAASSRDTEGQWTAAAWILERRYPEYFARRTEVTGANGGAINFESLVAKTAADLGVDPTDLMAEAEKLVEELASDSDD